MQRIELDFVRLPRGGRLGWVLLAAGALAAFVAVERHGAWLAEAGHWEQKASELRKMGKRAAVELREPRRDQGALAQEVRAANLVLRQLNIPWPRLFRELESAVDGSVALLSIQPDAAHRVLRVEGEARDYRALLDFVDRLDAAGLFASAHLASHQTRAEGARAVGFALLAGWVEPRGEN